jgi:hypothetical protein
MAGFSNPGLPDTMPRGGGPKLPRIVVLLVAVGILLVGDAYAPEPVRAALLLLLLYVVLANVGRVTFLADQIPAWLGRTLQPAARRGT